MSRVWHAGSGIRGGAAAGVLRGRGPRAGRAAHAPAGLRAAQHARLWLWPGHRHLGCARGMPMQNPKTLMQGCAAPTRALSAEDGQGLCAGCRPPTLYVAVICIARRWLEAIVSPMRLTTPGVGLCPAACLKSQHKGGIGEADSARLRIKYRTPQGAICQHTSRLAPQPALPSG